MAAGETRRISRGSNTGRAIVDRQTVHIYDMLAEQQKSFRTCGMPCNGGHSHRARRALAA